MTAHPEGLAILLCSLALPGAAFGQDGWDREPLVTDRPSFTESAAAVAPGRLQVEGGFTFTKNGEQHSQTLGEFVFRLGLVRRLEARLAVNPLSVVGRPGRYEAEGPDDITLGARVNLVGAPRGIVPQFAIQGAVVVPVKNDDRPNVAPALTLASAWNLSDDLSLGSNLGWTYGGVSEDRFSSISASLLFGVSLGKRWGTYAEYYGFVRTGDHPNEYFVDAGVTFLVSPDFQLDGRIGTGFEDPQPNYFAGIGASFRL
jgi:hypothetical protein